MPTLNWIGKEAIVKHHSAVPDPQQHSRVPDVYLTASKCAKRAKLFWTQENDGGLNEQE